MVRARSFVLILPLLGAGVLVQRGTTSDGPIARAAWLAGCWQMEQGESVIEEQWMPPRGGTMLEMSRTVRGGKLADYELVLLKEDRDGLVYEAHPSGQEGASFREHPGSAPGQLIFENPGHDFPQRVGYRKVATDSVTAWIAGSPGPGKPEKQIEFPYRRVNCGAGK